MVLKFTVLVKAIQNTNSHDFTHQSLSGHTDDLCNSALMDEPFLICDCLSRRQRFPLLQCRRHRSVFLNVHGRERQAAVVCCAETLTSYLSASRPTGHVAVNPCAQTAEPRRCSKVNQCRLEQSTAFHLFVLAACSRESR